MSPISQSNGIFSPNAFTQPSDGSTLTCSILVVGGSTAAYSAALTALSMNVDVCLVQSHAMVGGQFTAQGLPASDDGDLLKQSQSFSTVEGEKFAISKSQRWFRARQRQLQPVEGRLQQNPGGAWVCPITTTPVVSAIALNERLIPYLESGLLRLVPNSEPVEVFLTNTPGEQQRVTGVKFQRTGTAFHFTVNAPITLEATDFGDLLELAQLPSRVGQEARNDTGEAILPDHAIPQCQQSFTFNIVVEHTAPGQGKRVPAPAGYGHDYWLNPYEFTGDYWLKRSNAWQRRHFFEPYGIFRYRRIFRRSLSPKTISIGDIAVINWGTSPHPEKGECCGNDFRFGHLIGVSRAERQVLIQRARDRAQAYIHYLQTHGVPDLKTRGDLTWSADGIALEPYIREARRGIALTTIRHEDVAESFFPNQARARCFDDSVGVGQYHYLDLHGNLVAGHITPKGKDVTALPFSLPAKSLVPMTTDGLILSAKSIGTTHITNAAYRMHPVEWAIGEASGFLAVFCAWTGESPRRIVETLPLLRKLQGFMARNGIPIFWFDDVGHDDPDFEPIQVMAATGIIRSENANDLHFRPYANVSRAVVSTALVSLLELEKVSPASPSFSDVLPGAHWAYSNIETLKAQGIIAGVGGKRFAPNDMITRKQLSFLIKAAMPQAYTQAIANIPIDNQKLTRRELSRAFYELMKFKLDI
ncbi:MAG: FAD dependent oxidoreductase/S-layer homology domain [Phormidesmis priestleyi Ana]|uniref:FAD dependent oxidoreductase/S-layer homology domain n=1 Tax=Phormidesmis priestleyi Ana TaxID=1666911 RepID=A0A0P7Z0E7_9CYAN|nr:MAG: FAD dependent oxidoreductase/S-layer homology domain [Phormidesmis priestleyi Ana]